MDRDGLTPDAVAVEISLSQVDELGSRSLSAPGLFFSS